MKLTDLSKNGNVSALYDAIQAWEEARQIGLQGLCSSSDKRASWLAAEEVASGRAKTLDEVFAGNLMQGRFASLCKRNAETLLHSAKGIREYCKKGLTAAITAVRAGAGGDPPLLRTLREYAWAAPIMEKLLSTSPHWIGFCPPIVREEICEAVDVALSEDMWHTRKVHHIPAKIEAVRADGKADISVSIAANIGDITAKYSEEVRKAAAAYNDLIKRNPVQREKKKPVPVKWTKTATTAEAVMASAKEIRTFIGEQLGRDIQFGETYAKTEKALADLAVAKALNTLFTGVTATDIRNVVYAVAKCLYASSIRYNRAGTNGGRGVPKNSISKDLLEWGGSITISIDWVAEYAYGLTDTSIGKTLRNKITAVIRLLARYPIPQWAQVLGRDFTEPIWYVDQPEGGWWHDTSKPFHLRPSALFASAIQQGFSISGMDDRKRLRAAIIRRDPAGQMTDAHVCLDTKIDAWQTANHTRPIHLTADEAADVMQISDQRKKDPARTEAKMAEVVQDHVAAGKLKGAQVTIRNGRKQHTGDIKTAKTSPRGISVEEQGEQTAAGRLESMDIEVHNAGREGWKKEATALEAKHGRDVTAPPTPDGQEKPKRRRKRKV